jgi:NarL family two-component system sensor histidine kinase LiaS
MLAGFLVVLLILGGIWRGMEVSKASILLWLLQDETPKVVSLVDQADGTDRTTLAHWLQQQADQSSLLLSYEGSISILDQQGNVVASVGSVPQTVGTSLFSHFSTRNVGILQALLTGQNGPEGVLIQEIQGEVVAMVPIIGAQHQVLGVAIVQANHLQVIPWFGLGIGLVVLILPFLFFVLCVGMAGTIFGYITSRRLVRRFDRLVAVVDHWSRGDFSSLAYDCSEDELGQLVHRMNLMAKQLQSLVQTRQELAMLQERGRIARDLHDSIKQQVFALYMQIKGAKSLLLKRREGTLPRLEQAELLILQVQKDLNTLIHELRPAELEDKPFSLALREHVERWVQQTGIEASFQYEETVTLSPPLEDALYRFVQEALSNVARHSHARAIQVHVYRQAKSTCIVINDDGQGFDVVAPAKQGFGLRSMQERLKPFGGYLQIQSSLGEGTTVRAVLPL